MLAMMRPGTNDIHSLPRSSRSTLRRVKWPVLGLWTFGLVLAYVSPMQAVFPLLTATLGTFLLPGDPHLSIFDSCQRGCCCCRTRGLKMLPFFAVAASVACGLNIIYLLLDFPSFWKSLFQGGVETIASWSFLGSFACEITAFILCTLVWRAGALTAHANYSELPGHNQDLILVITPGTHNRSIRGTGLSNMRESDPPALPAGFQPFSGQGHRITE